MLNFKNNLRSAPLTIVCAGILIFATASCVAEDAKKFGVLNNGNATTPAVKPTANISPSPAASLTPPQSEATPEPKSPNEEKAAAAVGSKADLIIPVVGIRREDLRDTWGAARSEGRSHQGIDIIAPRGATVVAAGDGEIKFFDSVRGGITIYQINRERKLVYYYAHLDRRAENLKEGDFIRQGATLGYVGDTGNSGAGNYHLHFAVWTLDDPKRHWEGTNINPYTLLK